MTSQRIGRRPGKTGTAVLLMILTSFIYGFSFMFTRTVVAGHTAAVLLSWRHLISLFGILLLRLFGVIKINLRGKNITPLLLLALFQPVLYFVCETFGVALTSASEAGLVVATSPVVSMVLAAVMLKKPPTKLQAAAIPATTLGLVCIVLAASTGEAYFNPLGYLCLAGGVLCGSLFQVYSAKAEAFTVAEKTYVMTLFGAVVFSGWAIVETLTGGGAAFVNWATLPFRDANFAVAVLYLGIGSSIIGFLCQNYAIGVIGVTRSGAFGGLVTVVTVFSGIVILHEPFSWLQLLGGAIVLCGVYAANMQVGSGAGRDGTGAGRDLLSLRERSKEQDGVKKD